MELQEYDPGDPDLQRLSLLLARIGRQFAQVGLTDPDAIMEKLICRSLLALPLLKQAETIYDIGGGVGIPSLPLALKRPGGRVILIEPHRKACSFAGWLASKFESVNLEIINRPLEEVDFTELPSGQAVSRAALGMAELLELLPPTVDPVIKWSGDKPEADVESKKRKISREEVRFKNIVQQFLVARGGPD